MLASSTGSSPVASALYFCETVTETETLKIEPQARLAWEGTDTPHGTLSIDLTAASTVDANPDLLQHIFENLFRNATDHNEESVTVTVGSLTQNPGSDPDPIGFYIEDDGNGIPAAVREQIFEHGYTSNQSGTGLGLSIVHDFVTAHGWEISATDAYTGGARFEIKTE